MTLTRTRRWLLIMGVLGIAALLAFPLRDAIYETIVIPIAFIGFQVGLFYRSLSQAIWWWVIITLVLFMLSFSLVPPITPTRQKEPKPKTRYGQVEDMAIWLGRAKSGTYFKWLIANRLGKLAYQMLLHREIGRPRSVFAPLSGTDWKPSKELQKYLETGLHGSFSEFPTLRRLSAPPKTPLDFDVRDAVEFLEAQVESSDSK